MTEPRFCPSKDDLITYLYDDADPALAGRFEAHLRACEACAAEVDALRGVRVSLAQWAAPDLPVHVRLEADVPAPVPWPRRFLPAMGVAAAAVLVLAASAGLANVEVRRDGDGWSVRTGWARPGAAPLAAGSAAFTPERAAAEPAAAPAAVEPTPWRTDLAALEEQLRGELRAVQAQAVHSPAPLRADDEAWLTHIQSLIDESEVRQQRNLALRMTELSRDFDLQRKADLVTVQQGLGRLESRTEAEAVRARQMMNYIVRVSQQQQR
jgi:anti-sigma factor RsiW